MTSDVLGNLITLVEEYLMLTYYKVVGSLMYTLSARSILLRQRQLIYDLLLFINIPYHVFTVGTTPRSCNIN